MLMPRVAALIVNGLGVIGKSVAGYRGGRGVVVAEPDGGVVLAGRDVAVARTGPRGALRRVTRVVLAVPQVLDGVVDPSLSGSDGVGDVTDGASRVLDGRES